MLWRTTSYGFLSTLTKLTEKNTALLFKGGVGMYGGGAENRTPVQSKSAAGVSKLSCSLHLKQRTPSNLRLLFQPVQSFCKAYRLRPYKHLPKMTSPRKREHIPVWRAELLIKQREPSEAHKKECCQFNLTFPLFNVARRPRLAAHLKLTLSNPVTPECMRCCYHHAAFKLLWQENSHAKLPCHCWTFFSTHCLMG